RSKKMVPCHMLKENWRLISRLERVGDFMIVFVAFFAAYYGRDSLIFWSNKYSWNLPFAGPALAPIKDYFIVLIVALIGYVVSLNALGAYSSMRLISSLRILKVSIISSLLVFLSLATVLFLLKVDLSRSFILIFCILTGLALTAERYFVLDVLRYWRRRGRNFRDIIICGIGEQAVALGSEIIGRPELGIRIRGFADLAGPRDPKHENIAKLRSRLNAIGHHRIGRIIPGPKAFKKALQEYAIDEVIFTDLVDVMPVAREMIDVCAEQGVRTTIAADLFSVGMVQSQMSYFGGMPLIHFQTPPGDPWQLSIKRMVDIFLSLVLLTILSPLFLVVAVAIKLSSSGPIFFIQRRMGLNGRLFSLYKFRSMVCDAECKLEELKSKNEMQGPVFKMSNDPRITPVGVFLRRFSVDELPQLWNVLVGDMSLVGPRPPVPGEVGFYERRDRRRLSMRPGLTCTWQVSGRNQIKDFESWVNMDLEYIDNWSLKRDFSLLCKTVPAVLRGTGAS
ncbi:sugar transferase, partial [Oligoflexia bacterium]|nr:sugar transferase [Oligoflexia bacterium]